MRVHSDEIDYGHRSSWGLVIVMLQSGLVTTVSFVSVICALRYF